MTENEESNLLPFLKPIEIAARRVHDILDCFHPTDWEIAFLEWRGEIVLLKKGTCGICR